MNEQESPAKKSYKRLGKYALKIAVSALALYFVFTKIDFRQSMESIRNLNPLYFWSGFGLFILSQVVSVVRLGYICRAEEMDLPFGYNLRLYFVGMAYNLFLPGGVGGDAYKAILFSGKFGVKVKKVLRALLYDRLSGLLAIAVLIVFLASVVDLPGSWPYRHWYYLLSAMGVLISWLLLRWISKQYRSFFSATLLLALAVQFLQALAILMFASSLEGGLLTFPEHYPSLMLIFFSSSVATAIPVFLGGIGAREAVFGGMALWLGMNEQVMVQTAILFSISTILGSLPGIPLDWMGRRARGNEVAQSR